MVGLAWYSLGFESSVMENRIVKIPIRFDDFDLYRRKVDFEEWSRLQILSTKVILSLFVCMIVMDLFGSRYTKTFSVGASIWKAQNSERSQQSSYSGPFCIVIAAKTHPSRITVTNCEGVRSTHAVKELSSCVLESFFESVLNQSCPDWRLLTIVERRDRTF